MAFRVFDDSGQGAYFVLLIISVLVATAAVVLRFVATSLSHRKPGLEDWLALAAVLVFLPRAGVAFNGTSARPHGVLARSCRTPAVLTRVYVLAALVIINGRGLDLAFDTVSYENAFKVCSSCPLVLSRLSI
jgi:hypothetical protein